MKIAIIGAGGVGGYFGAKLAHAGNHVTFVARGSHLEAMQKNGLQVKSILGDFTIENVKAVNSISALDHPDLVVTCVKAWQIKEIRSEIRNVLHAESMVLPLQNGVMAVEELSEVIDKKNILNGLCRIISKIESPGVINHFGVTPAIVFGELNKSLSERATHLEKIFATAGIETKLSTDIEADVWKKFISICVSALLAVTRTTYGQLRELPQTRQMMIELIEEIYALSQKIGVNIKPDFVSKTVAFIDTFPYDSTSSLTRDVWEGKPSEIEYQNGTVVRLGEKFGISTPINKFIYHCILPGELKARGLK